MAKIEIRGVIVSSDYDAEWYESYIDKGVITPESSFRRALDAAPTGERLDLYINSPGGSVFAGYEMLNTVREWRAITGQEVRVTLGGLAASMGAYLAAYLGPVRVHSNTKIMFHGASGGAFGGAGAMQDEADLLAKINAELTTLLATRYNLDSDTVSGWFAEGRMGWLDAAEATAAGLANEVIGDLAAMPVNESFEGENGARVAACWEMLGDGFNDGESAPYGAGDPATNHAKTTTGGHMSTLQKIMGKLGFSPQEGESQEAAEARLERLTAALPVGDVQEHYQAGLDLPEVIALMTDDHAAALKTAGEELTATKAELATAQAAKVEAEAKAAQLTEALEDAKKRGHVIVAGSDEPVDIKTMHDEMVAGGLTKTAAWRKIAADHGEEYAAYIAAGK